MYLPYGPAITLLDIYTREMKGYVFTKTSTCIHSSFIFFFLKPFYFVLGYSLLSILAWETPWTWQTGVHEVAKELDRLSD